MRSSGISMIMSLLAAAILIGACTAADVGASSEGIDHSDLEAFVDEAAAYAADNGKENALKEFNDKSGKFVRGELYIFANDIEGVSMAHPFRPEFVGNSQIELKDVNGVLFIKNMNSMAKRGGGSVYYVFANPAHDKKEELKLVCVEKIDDSWYLGSGTYLSEIPSSFSQESRDEMVTLVDQALKYAQENGKEKALEAFNDKNGQFIKGGLYIFANGIDGTALAHPMKPEFVGKSQIDLQDSNGINFIKDMAEQARTGDGFTYYIFEDPSKNNEQRLKLTYVASVDDDWYIGAGTYAE